jgi:signal recognition particle subunit SRP54
MGDIVGLVSQAMTKFDQDQAQRMQERLEKGQFSLDDFMEQMSQMKKLGPMNKVMGMIPGMGELSKQINMDGGEVESQMGRMQAIFNSMTRKERAKPDMIDTGRRRRIAAGAGVQMSAVGQMLKQFETTRDMVRAVGGMGMRGKLGMMKSLMSGGLAGLAGGFGGGGYGGGGGGMLPTKRSGFMEKKDRNKKKKRR